MARGCILALLTLFLTIVNGDGLYTKDSPVLQVTAKTYDSLIARSNHTSILEFYAPWCGHCKQLQPAYEKAAKGLAGLAKVAAINCDEETNKPLCGQMGVQGFPTLKIIKPGSKPGKPVIDDYQGARTAKAITDAVLEKIPNHVKKLQDSGLEGWLSENQDRPKAVLFTEKGTISPLFKALAVEFLGGIDLAQIRNKEAAAVEKFSIKKFPSLVLFPGSQQEPMTYAGEMKKESLVAFLSQAAAPNPDPAPKKAKPVSKKTKSAAPTPGKSSPTSGEKPAVPLPEDIEDLFADAQTIVLDENMAQGTAIPIVPKGETPVPLPDIIPPIQQLSTPSELKSACLTAKSGNCILVLLPLGSDPEAVLPESAASALASLAEIADKHVKRHAKIFPFYGIPAENEAAQIVRGDLGLRTNSDLEIIALNMKRGWWRLYRGEEYSVMDLEGFVDAIKLGEGTKERLPEGFFVEENQPSEPEIFNEEKPTIKHQEL